MNDLIHWIQDWYANQCDGDWEHMYGIRIETLDNPGWGVHIDLAYTDLEERPFTQVEVKTSEDDWYVCRVRENVFEGAAGPHNLAKILQVFIDWVEQ
jgi:hypothetical protein